MRQIQTYVMGLSSCFMLAMALIIVQTATTYASAICNLSTTCAKDCQWDLDSNGCPSCVCPTCKTKICQNGEICKMYQLECPQRVCPVGHEGHCAQPDCPIRPVCVPDTTTTTITTTNAPKPPCPIPLCPRGCPPVRGPDGCLHCVCLNCQNLTCDSGEECVMQSGDCSPEEIPCVPYPTCVPLHDTTTTTITTRNAPKLPCPIPLCLRGCPLVRGPDGCLHCVCLDCQNLTCDSGEECVMQGGDCSPEEMPCVPHPTCVPLYETTTKRMCRKLKCLPICFPGTGSDGCPICDCPPTCQDNYCSEDEECVLQEVICKKEPCFPQPTCVPRNDSCMGLPNVRSCGPETTRWTYNSSVNSCLKFQYYGCAPSPNTFLDWNTCASQCMKSKFICHNVLCEDSCHLVARENECPECICPNTCKGYICPVGTECKLREANIGDKKLEPFCSPKHCPLLRMCGIACPDGGLKRNEQGCEICQCQ